MTYFCPRHIPRMENVYGQVHCVVQWAVKAGSHEIDALFQYNQP